MKKATVEQHEQLEKAKERCQFALSRKPGWKRKRCMRSIGWSQEGSRCQQMQCIQKPETSKLTFQKLGNIGFSFCETYLSFVAHRYPLHDLMRWRATWRTPRLQWTWHGRSRTRGGSRSGEAPSRAARRTYAGGYFAGSLLQQGLAFHTPF